jgi:hypothetical protein
MGAPGIGGRSTLIVTLLVIAYLAFRFSTAVAWRPFEQDVGLGFTMMSANEATQRFGGFPLWMYAYNAACTFANMLFSEPIAGRFGIVRDVMRGEWLPWEINHVLTSTVTTGLIGWWGVRTWRREGGRPWTVETRVFAAAVISIAASTALGFNYSRDRLGGMAAPFYALAAFYAVRAVAARAATMPRSRAIGFAIVLLLLGGGWQLRAIGTVDWVNLKSTKVHREWLTDLARRRTDFAGQSDYLRIMEAMVPQGVERAPAAAPPWLSEWLGER